MSALEFEYDDEYECELLEDNDACEHEYEHVDHLETVADKYREELYACSFYNKEKVVVKPLGVRD